MEEQLNGSANLYNEAKNYAEMGIPVGPAQEKKILIEGWTKLSSAEFLNEKYKSYWKTATGIGVLCGEASGIICLDIDIDKAVNPKLIAEITAKIPPVLSGKIGNPNRRPAQFFRYNGEVGRKFTSIGVEILSTGGQTIIPPSKHPMFSNYEWVGTPLNQLSDIDELPVLPDGFVEWLEEKNEQYKNGKKPTDKTATPASGRCSHNSHNIISALAFALFKQNYPFDMLLERILKRDKEINYGSDFLYFNCPTRPWKHKDTVKNAKDFLAEMFKRHEQEVIAANPMPEENNDSPNEKTKKNKGEIELLPLKELLERPDEAIPYLVENLLPAGGTSIMAAKPKVGKTTLLRQLSLCVSRGEMFLGRGCSKGPVIYFSVEEKINEIKNHFKDMGADGSEEIYIFAERAPADTLKKLKPVVEKMKPSLIILDTLFKVVRMKDANDYASISAALEPIQELARQSNAHIMCVHHAGKAERDGADGILGSTAILGAFDTAIIMSRNDKKRTIRTIQRYGDDIDESVLHWDKKTRMSSLGQEKWKERSDEKSKEVLDFVKKVGRPVSFADVKAGTGLDLKILRDTLGKMVDLKLLSVSGLGIKGDPKMYSAGLL